MSAATADAVRALLARGPLPEAQLLRQLDAVGVTVPPGGRDDLWAEAGAIALLGAGGATMVAQAAAADSDPRTDPLAARRWLARRSPVVIVAALLAMVLVVALLLSALNKGWTVGPIQPYRPPAGAVPG